MPHASSIIHLKHHEIDKQLWDKTIASSTNSLIYAHSFYLDHMCPGWSAILSEDYHWVLPITARNKYGIKYLFQPPFTQQLGVFSQDHATIPWQAIIAWLQQHYSFCEVNWNYLSIVDHHQIQIAPATNYVIDLTPGYESIEQQYHKDLKKNLKRSQQFNLQYLSTIDYKLCIDLYVSHYANRTPHVTTEDYHQFTRLCKYAFYNKMLQCRMIKNDANEILATALLLYDGKRLYNMMNTNTVAGRKTEANHFLIDRIIHEFSSQQLLFDFEGSDLPGVKSFYENFAPVNQPYYFVRYNNLPWLLRLLKK